MTFPNLKDKYKYKALFNPEDFLEYKKWIGRYPKCKSPSGVIICYNMFLMDYILKNHKAAKVQELGNFYLLGEAKNKIAIVGGIGGSSAVTTAEELIAFGVRKFVTIGDAGTLQREIKINDIVVCDKAIRDEGTSHHYLKDSKYSYASKDLTKKIKDALKRHGLRYTVGTSWTTDAGYRETIKEVKKYQKEGVATVETEASALFALGQYRKVDVGAIFVISDSLVESKWKNKFHLSKEYYEDVYRAILEALT